MPICPSLTLIGIGDGVIRPIGVQQAIAGLPAVRSVYLKSVGFIATWSSTQ